MAALLIKWRRGDPDAFIVALVSMLAMGYFPIFSILFVDQNR
jgi:hypothetical protein